MKTSKERKHKEKWPKAVYGLGAACVAALVVLVIVAIAPWEKKEQAQEGKFTPPPFDTAAVAGTPEVDEALGWSELALRSGYTVKVCGELTARPDGTVPVWLYSYPDNDVWVKLRILDEQGNRLGETGLLKPGEYVELVQLAEGTAGGNVTLHIMGYEPDTYYSAGAVDFTTVLTVQ